MKFGRLDTLEQNTHSLPEDNPLTAKVLGGKPAVQPLIFIGCPVWAEPKMVGTTYPKGTKSKDFLRVYATLFNAIEQNATGYGIPEIEEVRAWTEQVPEGFVFCPKVPQQLARSAPLAKNDVVFQDFMRACREYGKHLGSVFLQLHPSFSPVKFDQLVDFIARWDKNIPLQIELRHPDWFASDEEFGRLAALLKQNKVGLIITDVTARRDVLHQCLTTKTAFIRFDGHDLDPKDFVRLDQWAVRVGEWLNAGLERLYFFVHTPTKHLNPYLAKYFRDRLHSLGVFGPEMPM